MKQPPATIRTHFDLENPDHVKVVEALELASTERRSAQFFRDLVDGYLATDKLKARVAELEATAQPETACLEDVVRRIEALEKQVAASEERYKIQVDLENDKVAKRIEAAKTKAKTKAPADESAPVDFTIDFPTSMPLKLIEKMRTDKWLREANLAGADLGLSSKYLRMQDHKRGEGFYYYFY